MKREKGKKLSLQKFSIAKLNSMSLIKGGYKPIKTREPDGCPSEMYYQYTNNNNCQTQARNCTDPSGPTVIGI